MIFNNRCQSNFVSLVKRWDLSGKNVNVLLILWDRNPNDYGEFVTVGIDVFLLIIRRNNISNCLLHSDVIKFISVKCAEDVKDFIYKIICTWIRIRVTFFVESWFWKFLSFQNIFLDPWPGPYLTAYCPA